MLSARSFVAVGRPAEAIATLAEARDLATRFLAPVHPVHAELSDLEARIPQTR